MADPVRAKKAIEEYLSTVQIYGAIATRVLNLYDYCQTMCNDRVENIFISQVREPDNTWSFPNLIFFTTTTVMKIDRFVTDQAILIARLRDITNAAIEDFNKLRTTDPIHRVSGWAQWHPIGYSIAFNATDKNCDKLLEVWNRYIVPELFRS
jgi:hypothetical protein